MMLSLENHPFFTPWEDRVYEVELADRQRKLIWPRTMYHARCDGQKRFYCGDQYPYEWNDRKPCSVWLMDRNTGKDAAIASSLPQPPVPMGRWREYHMDPHPHFSANGNFVIYTTTALGAINVALCPVDQAADRM
ncbi:MAG: hypothetical protein ACLFV7_03870 [Phycisphaerae bacterium]